MPSPGRWKGSEDIKLQDLSLHIFDIVENSLRANAKHIEIKLIRNVEQDKLILEVRDDGIGMSPETRKRSLNPFFTTKKGKKVGLGLSLLAQSAEETGGEVEVESIEGKGTTVKAVFTLSHVDIKPLGNLEETVRCLKATHPDIHFCFNFENLNN